MTGPVLVHYYPCDVFGGWVQALAGTVDDHEPDGVLDEASRALLDALDRLDSPEQMRAAPFQEAKHPRIPEGYEGGGRFRRLADRVFDALEKWAKGEGPDDPLGDTFTLPQLRQVAKERGIPVRRRRPGEDEQVLTNEIKNALLAQVREGHGGKPAAKKASPAPAARKAVPSAAPAKEAKAAKKAAPSVRAAKVTRPAAAPNATQVRQRLIDATSGQQRREYLQGLGLSTTQTRTLARDLGVRGAGRLDTDGTIDQIVSHYDAVDDTTDADRLADERYVREGAVRREADIRTVLADADRRGVVGPVSSNVGAAGAHNAAVEAAVDRGFLTSARDRSGTYVLTPAGRAHLATAPAAPRVAKAAPVASARVTPASRDLTRDPDALSRIAGPSEYGSSHGDEQLYRLTEYRGWNGQPRQVDKRTFDAMIARGRPEMWRGNDYQEHADRLVTGEVYFGSNAVGPGEAYGIAAASDRPAARRYGDVMLRMTLAPGARIVTVDDLDQERDDWLAELPPDDREFAIDSFGGNLGRFAAARGYDAILLRAGDGKPHDMFKGMSKARQAEEMDIIAGEWGLRGSDLTPEDIEDFRHLVDDQYVVVNRSALVVDAETSHLSPSARTVPAPTKVAKAAPAAKAVKKAAAPATGRRALAAAPVSLDLDEQGDPVLRGMPTDLDPAAVTTMTASAYRYTWEHFIDINQVLHARARGENPNVDPQTESDIANLRDLFQHSPLQRDVIVYRGMRDPSRLLPPGEWSRGSLQGKEWTDPAFGSSSVDERVARDYILGEDDQPGPNPTVLRILVPKGTSAISASGALAMDARLAGQAELMDDRELLLPAGLRYRVVADHGYVDVDGDQVRRLDVEVVPSSSPAAPKVAKAAPAVPPTDVVGLNTRILAGYDTELGSLDRTADNPNLSAGDKTQAIQHAERMESDLRSLASDERYPSEADRFTAMADRIAAARRRLDATPTLSERLSAQTSQRREQLIAKTGEALDRMEQHITHGPSLTVVREMRASGWRLVGSPGPGIQEWESPDGTKGMSVGFPASTTGGRLTFMPRDGGGRFSYAAAREYVGAPAAPKVAKAAPAEPVSVAEAAQRLPSGPDVYYHSGTGDLDLDREIFLAPNVEASTGYLQGGPGTVTAFRLRRDARLADEEDIQQAAAAAFGDVETEFGYRPYTYELADRPEVRRQLAATGFAGATYRDLGPDNRYQHDTTVVWDRSAVEVLGRQDVSPGGEP